MKEQEFVFGKRNYLLMIGGLALMALGYLLMMGGGSEDPEVFNPDIFNAQRLVWAPIILVSGLVLEVYAILSAKS